MSQAGYGPVHVRNAIQITVLMKRSRFEDFAFWGISALISFINHFFKKSIIPTDFVILVNIRY